jgi:protein-L-isoaspartate(D-aspartate) O-methyltransferase
VSLAAEQLSNADAGQGDVPGSAHDAALGAFVLGLRTRGLRDQRVFAAIEKASRARFLPLAYVDFAYRDISLPLPCGQETGAAQMIVQAVAALELGEDHQVLEIGTGSGWQTALLAELSGAVASLERWYALAKQAGARLREAGLRNAVVIHGDGLLGLREGAPYDRIILNGAVTAVPSAIQKQLAPGGVLIAPLLGAGGQMLMRYRKSGGELRPEVLGPCRYPRLVEGVSAAL